MKKRRPRATAVGIILLLIAAIISFSQEDPGTQAGQAIAAEPASAPVAEVPALALATPATDTVPSFPSVYSGTAPPVQLLPSASAPSTPVLVPAAHAAVTPSVVSSPAPVSAPSAETLPFLPLPSPPVIVPVAAPGELSGANLIPDADLELAGTSGAPQGWFTSSDGNNVPAFAYPVPGRNGGKAASVTLNAYKDGEADWYFKKIAATPGSAYAFSDHYTATIPSYVSVQFDLSDGTQSWTLVAILPPSAVWATAQGVFTVPEKAVTMTVYHLIKGEGTLTTDDYSLTALPSSFSQGFVSINFDDGWRSDYNLAFPILSAARLPATYYIVTSYLGFPHYMTRQEVLTLEASGNEIGAHTRTHANLTTLSPQALASEVQGSAADLRALGVAVSTFAYPYGAYNAATDMLVRQSGFLAARTTDDGVNFPESNKYLLRAEVVSTQTPISQVEGWIDEAVRDHKWLILVFHQINGTDLGGDLYTIPVNDFEDIIQYLLIKKVPVVTSAQGLKYLSGN